MMSRIIASQHKQLKTIFLNHNHSQIFLPFSQKSNLHHLTTRGVISQYSSPYFLCEVVGERAAHGSLCEMGRSVGGSTGLELRLCIRSSQIRNMSHEAMAPVNSDPKKRAAIDGNGNEKVKRKKHLKTIFLNHNRSQIFLPFSQNSNLYHTTQPLDKSKNRDGLRARQQFTPRLEQALESLKAQAVRKETEPKVAIESNETKIVSGSYGNDSTQQTNSSSDNLRKIMNGNEELDDEESATESELMSDSEEDLSDISDYDEYDHTPVLVKVMRPNYGP